MGERDEFINVQRIRKMIARKVELNRAPVPILYAIRVSAVKLIEQAGNEAMKLHTTIRRAKNSKLKIKRAFQNQNNNAQIETTKQYQFWPSFTCIRFRRTDNAELLCPEHLDAQRTYGTERVRDKKKQKDKRQQTGVKLLVTVHDHVTCIWIARFNLHEHTTSPSYWLTDYLNHPKIFGTIWYLRLILNG